MRIRFGDRNDIGWALDHGNLLMLARFLYVAGFFNKVSDVIYFFEKPWKYANEWKVYLELRQSPEFEEYQAKEYIPKWVTDKLYGR